MAYANDTLSFSANDIHFSFQLAGENMNTLNLEEPVILLDQLVTQPQKLTGIILSKLKLNTSVYARQCIVKKVDKAVAEEFLNRWHLMGATQSSYNPGLFYKDELVALASFSKGRKMNRLPEDKRSFEMIRFCCKSGITVTGGLTKLLKHFCTEKKAGDIMTYVDKQLSDGRSFITAGFKKHSETEPNYFLVERDTFERIPLKDKDESFDTKKFYLAQNSGNIKLVYTPNDLL